MLGKKNSSNQSPIGSTDQAAETKENLQELEAKCEQYLGGWQRARADYDNLKRETDKNLKDLKRYIKAELILDLLPVYDHYTLALSHIPEHQKESDWVQGIMHIHREFADFLKQQGVEEINTKGQLFNPELHEAVATEESLEAEDMIVKEIKTGYIINDTVLRPAQVIVSKPSNQVTININKEGQPSENIPKSEPGIPEEEN
jgi:molecular chaperone GrpE (heat shock protein)